MIYALLILSSANQASSETAFRFAEAAVAAGHRIERVFFYAEGVYHANKLQQPPQGCKPTYSRWQQLSKEHNIDLVVCIAAALKRGICDEQEADRYNLDAANLAAGFSLSGLGQLVDSAISADRLITFG